MLSSRPRGSARGPGLCANPWPWRSFRAGPPPRSGRRRRRLQARGRSPSRTASPRRGCAPPRAPCCPPPRAARAPSVAAARRPCAGPSSARRARRAFFLSSVLPTHATVSPAGPRRPRAWATAGRDADSRGPRHRASGVSSRCRGRLETALAPRRPPCSGDPRRSCPSSEPPACLSRTGRRRRRRTSPRHPPENPCRGGPSRCPRRIRSGRRTR